MNDANNNAKRNQPWLHGCGTALVTPFRPNGMIDEDLVGALVTRQVDAGVHFLVPCGTTGEGTTLTHQEKVRVAELVVEAAAGAVPVIAGCGGNDTSEVVALARSLEGTGAAGLLVVTPYYNKPTPDGLFLHYSAVAGATSLPIVVYNVPSRTGVNLAPATLARLASIPGVMAVKEAAGDIFQVAWVLQSVPSDFAVLTGDDAATLPAIALGAHGVISVVSNQIPGPMAELCDRCLAGDFAAARPIHHRWLPLMDANFIETNPGPVKYAMAEMGLLEARYRLPMTAVSAENRRRLRDVMESLEM
ncbi:MAG: 4-hydroxy-tetrahydrodipicolinate synthase [Gemmatimonadetes bacterium]|nr:4-hydroxy-tetrahydrodipicolinate synthase [Gemmatimonadota bacterium]MYK65455.1 4-hydroxy-tetrahydrodipicolinate synthase [Gemmatimonadota bacterium]